MRARQLSFLPSLPLQHGGDTRKGRRKIARPLDPKRPVHLTLSSSRAHGASSLLRPVHRGRVERLLRSIAEKRGIRILRYANVGNHLHVVLQTRTRRGFQDFLREFAGKTAILVTGAIKGRASGKFWDTLAWSRVVNYGKDLRAVLAYVLKNLLEAEGSPRRELKADPPPDPEPAVRTPLGLTTMIRRTKSRTQSC